SYPNCFTILLRNPAGTSLNSVWYCGGANYIDTTTLATAGTYSIHIDPSGTDTGSVSVAINLVAADSSTAVNADGTAHTVTTSLGQVADLTFTGTTNQQVSVNVSNGSYPRCFSVLLRNPAGTSLNSVWYCGGSTSIPTTTLAGAGTYSIHIDPPGTDTGSITVAVNTVAGGGAISAIAVAAAPDRTSDVSTADELRPVHTLRPRPPAKAHPAIHSHFTPVVGASTADELRSVHAVRPPSAITSQFSRAAQPTAAALPAWVTTTPSSRDGWQPSRSNLAGADWLSHRIPAAAASLPPLTAVPGVTALAGQVLTVGGTPLPNVTLSADGHSTRSDRAGRFLLTGISAGQRVLLIDGGTASTPGRRFGIFQVSVHTIAGRTVPLGYTIWLTKLDIAHASTIPSPTTRQTVLTTPEIPGFEVILPAGTVVRDLQGHVVRQLSITPVPTDRPPFPLPPGVNTPAYFTVQPGGSYIFPQGAQIIYPNSLHARPGSRVQFYNYDPKGRGWYVYGGGSVTADGKQVVPDPGVRVWEFTGAMINSIGDFLDALGRALGNLLSFLAAADPVDPGTGLFSFGQTDLVEPDTLPLTLTRSYRQMDTNQFVFGQGFNWTYGMFLSSAQQYQQADLVFPNGSHIHFIRTSPGTGWADAVFRATNGWGDFANAVMAWNGNGWDVTGHTGLIYVFGENQPLQSIRDRYGNQITITRSSGGQSGNITQVTSPHGLWIRLSYNSSNQVTQAVDNAGRTVSYSYDASGRLSQVTNATGGTTKYTWDANNNLLTVTDALNHIIASNTYDSNNRVASQQLGNGGTFTFGYTTDANNKIIQTDVTDPDSHIIRYTFNADGVVTSKTLAPGTSSAETWSYTLAPTTDYLTSTTDPLGHQTSYTYDSNGNVTSQTLMAGTSSTRTTTFDTSGPYGQVVSVTDPLGHRTNFSYNTMGSLASVTNAASQVTSYTYAPDGQLASVANTTQDKVTDSYNPLGQLVASTDPLNRATQYWNDAVNRPVITTASDGGQTVTSYDAGNHVTRVVDAVGRQAGYSYNLAGQLTTITDANLHTTTYTYDTDGRSTGWVQTGGASLSRSYDPAGNLASTTDGRGKITTISYDVLNRPSVVKYGVSGSTATSSISYGYDALNRVTSLQDSVDGTTSIGYDNVGEPTTVTTPQGTISYSYDAAGRRTGMTVAGGTPISYGYTAANALASISQGSTTVNYAYDTDGRPTSIALPGATQSYTYDTAGQLSSINYTSGSTTLGTINYSYDPVGRVVGESGSWARLALPAAMTATYNAANEATAVKGVAQSYDAAGHLTNDGTNSYSWNDRGQLASVTGTGVNESYGYNPSGLRTRVTSGASSTSYLWDLSGNQVAELTGGSVSATELTGPGTDRTLVRTDANGSRSQLTDRLGSTVATTDATGVVKSQFGYTPYGQQAASGESIAGAPGFTGRTSSSATGLQYNRDRYYNPTLGRFISQDPTGQAGGLNTYAYAYGNPTNVTDPSGDAGTLMTVFIVATLAPEAIPFIAAGLDLDIAGMMAAVAGEATLDATVGDVMVSEVAAGEAAAGEAAGAGEAASTGADNIANGPRLAEQLARESAESAFTDSGELASDMITGAKQIKDGSELGNPAVISDLTSDGSNISDWGKYSTRIMQSPSGDFEVHFYMNPTTGAVNYNFDYKVIFSGAL
ncbi:RHS repeat-associated core domain-containing protein, partial [Jatrophihabitans sp.]|uniref:RHS repeat-associated core domain-containing protein n=1 Tax=Jatrophihabitans sp. TaxID=1932789 RepID=UPI002C15B78B|nr:RHS repeat-associated core domain-containing protein [Jatrophihabitans sp.]